MKHRLDVFSSLGKNWRLSCDATFEWVFDKAIYVLLKGHFSKWVLIRVFGQYGLLALLCRELPFEMNAEIEQI